MSENIEFRLKVIEDNLTKALDSSEKKAKSLGNTLEIALGTFISSAIVSGLDLVSDGFSAMTDFIKDSVQAASESQESLNRLQVSLAQTGILTADNVRSFQDLADQIQKTTAFEDDAVIANTALIQSLARLDAEGLKRATIAATDLAATFNIDLETASRLVGKAAEGNITQLQKLGIEFSKGVNDAGTFANALGAIEQRFGGAAQSQAKTYAGAITQLANGYDGLQENVGNLIIQNPAVIAAFGTLKIVITSVAESISQSFGTTNSDVIASFFRSIIDGANFIVLAADSIVRVFDIVSSTVLASIRLMALGIVAPIAGILELTAAIPGIGDAFREAADSSTAEMNRLSTAFDANIKSIDDAVNRETALSKLSLGLADVRTSFDILYSDVKGKSEELKNNLNISSDVEDDGALRRQQELNTSLIEAESLFTIEKNRLSLENEIVENEQFIAKSNNQLRMIADFELQKNKIKYDSEIAAANRLATEEEKNLAKKKALSAKELADLNVNSKLKNDIRRNDVANQKDTFATIATLSQSNNSTLAAIGKAAGITQIAIDTPVAISKALAAFPPPFNFVAAGLVATAMAAQASRIAGVKGFANGGIIGATSGPDDTIATVRKGEMILNANQQEKLFNAINSGGLGGGDIVVQIDGREIARAVRSQRQQGFVI